MSKRNESARSALLLKLALLPALALTLNLGGQEAWGKAPGEVICSGTSNYDNTSSSDPGYPDLSKNRRGSYSVNCGNSRARSDYAIAIGNGAGAGVVPNGGAQDSATTDPVPAAVSQWPKENFGKGQNAISIGHSANNFSFDKRNNDKNHWEFIENSVSIGPSAHTHRQQAVSIGFSSDATGIGAIATGAYTGPEQTKTAHWGAWASGDSSIAMGDRAGVVPFDPYKHVDPVYGIDYKDEGSRQTSHPEVSRSIAAGTGSFVQTRDAIAIGGGYRDIPNIHDPNIHGLGATIAGPVYDANGYVAQPGDQGAVGGVALGGAYGSFQSARVAASRKGNVTRGDHTSGGVAMGPGAVADRAAGVDDTGRTRSGYDMLRGGDSNLASPTWRSTMAAHSVGDVSKGITRQITNVAAGSEDTDAINVAQLKRAREAVDNMHFYVSANGKRTGVYGGETVFFDGDGNIHVDLNGQIVSINLDPNLKLNSITVRNGGPRMDAGGINMANTPITNVADGVAPNDAVNKGQLDDMDDRLRSGVATAVALANIPLETTPGGQMLGAGIGWFRDEPALAVGWSARSDNGRWIWRTDLGWSSEEVVLNNTIGFEF